MAFTRRAKRSKNTPIVGTCPWCGLKLRSTDGRYLTAIYDPIDQDFRRFEYICNSCSIIASHALDLAREVAQIIQKGGRQLYIAVEKTGQETELISAKRWSPLEPLESASSAETSFTTYR